MHGDIVSEVMKSSGIGAEMDLTDDDFQGGGDRTKCKRQTGTRHTTDRLRNCQGNG